MKVRSIARTARGALLSSLLGCCVSCASQEPQRPPPQNYPPNYGGYGQPPPGYGQPYRPPQQGYPPSTGYPSAPPPYGAPTTAPTTAPPTAGPPTSAPPPPPSPTQPPTTPPPPATTALPPPPFGSFDLSGSTTPQFMRQEPLSVLAELIAALPPTARAKVQGVPVKIIEDPKEVNAFAGCTEAGAPFVAVTAPLLLIMARTSETRAFDETAGTAKYNDLANGIANEVKAQKTVAGPSPGFLPLPQALDPRKLARQKFLFDEQLAFVLGHELAHHHRDHTGCANGSSATSTITPRDIGRFLSSTVPLFNQPNEFEADLQGTFNLLDTGSKRQGGAWTEEGAQMTLDFFSRLQSLGVETVVLGFLMTHPPPQLRLQVVNGAAREWRNGGGKAPAFPFQLPG